MEIPEGPHTHSVAPRYRYFDVIVGVFVTALIASNVVSAKIGVFGGHVLGCGILVFPISYIFGDVLTEVYGYARSRRVIWIGFLCALLTAALFAFSVAVPPAPEWHGQQAFASVLGQVPRVVLASAVAYLCGEFANSFVLARLKVATEGRHLWMRTIGSTLVGQLVDSVVFYPLAFYGSDPVWTWAMIARVGANNYALKVAVETLFTPVTYVVVNYLKRAEQEDVFDTETDFNPLKLKVE